MTIHKTFSCYLIALLIPLTALADPAWWSNGVLNGNPANDDAIATVGQLKNIAARAWEHLDSELMALGHSDGAGFELELEVKATDNRAANQGQLKAQAIPFYQRLSEVGYSGHPLDQPEYYWGFPWSQETTDDQEYSVVKLGQLKHSFSFEVSDGTVPFNTNANNTTVENRSQDDDNDGLSLGEEEILGTADDNTDSDNDGVSDRDDFSPNEDALSWKGASIRNFARRIISAWDESVHGNPVDVNDSGDVIFENGYLWQPESNAFNSLSPPNPLLLRDPDDEEDWFSLSNFELVAISSRHDGINSAKIVANVSYGDTGLTNLAVVASVANWLNWRVDGNETLAPSLMMETPFGTNISVEFGLGLFQSWDGYVINIEEPLAEFDINQLDQKVEVRDISGVGTKAVGRGTSKFFVWDLSTLQNSFATNSSPVELSSGPILSGDTEWHLSISHSGNVISGYGGNDTNCMLWDEMSKDETLPNILNVVCVEEIGIEGIDSQRKIVIGDILNGGTRMRKILSKVNGVWNEFTADTFGSAINKTGALVQLGGDRIWMDDRVNTQGQKKTRYLKDFVGSDITKDSGPGENSTSDPTSKWTDLVATKMSWGGAIAAIGSGDFTGNIDKVAVLYPIDYEVETDVFAFSGQNIETNLLTFSGFDYSSSPKWIMGSKQQPNGTRPDVMGVNSPLFPNISVVLGHSSGEIAPNMISDEGSVTVNSGELIATDPSPVSSKRNAAVIEPSAEVEISINSPDSGSNDIRIAGLRRAELIVRVFPVGQASPNLDSGYICARGKNNDALSVSQEEVGGDDVWNFNLLRVGPNGICETSFVAGKGDYVWMYPPPKTIPWALPGEDSEPAYQNAKVEFEVQFGNYLNNIFGNQSNVWFTEVVLEPLLRIHWEQGFELGAEDYLTLPGPQQMPTNRFRQAVLDAGDPATPEMELIIGEAEQLKASSPTEIRVFWIGSGANGLQNWVDNGGGWVSQGTLRGIAVRNGGEVQKACFVADTTENLIKSATFGQELSIFHTAAHEIGHVLGLFHVNRAHIPINRSNRRTEFGRHLMVEGGGFFTGERKFLNKAEWHVIHSRIGEDFETAFVH